MKLIKNKKNFIKYIALSIPLSIINGVMLTVLNFHGWVFLTEIIAICIVYNHFTTHVLGWEW